jgi:hypothetical protein
MVVSNGTARSPMRVKILATFAPTESSRNVFQAKHQLSFRLRPSRDEASKSSRQLQVEKRRSPTRFNTTKTSSLLPCPHFQFVISSAQASRVSQLIVASECIERPA